MVSLPPVSPPRSYTPPLSSPIRATCPAHLILDFITRTILGEQYRSFSSLLCNLLHSPCYHVPPRSKYSPQHHILKHPQLPFLSQCQPIKGNNLARSSNICTSKAITIAWIPLDSKDSTVTVATMKLRSRCHVNCPILLPYCNKIVVSSTDVKPAILI